MANEEAAWKGICIGSGISIIRQCRILLIEGSIWTVIWRSDWNSAWLLRLVAFLQSAIQDSAACGHWTSLPEAEKEAFAIIR